MIKTIIRTIVAAALAAVLAASVAQPATAAVPDLEFTETNCQEYSDSVARLYTAGLNRVTEQKGFEFWLGQYQIGAWSLTAMAEFFASSPEFIARYGEVTNRGFVEQLYRNVLKREGEEEGIVFWTGRLDSGNFTRGDVLLSFSESPENVTRSGTSEPLLGDFNIGLTAPWTCGGTPSNPGDVVNCSDFRSQVEAQRWFDIYFPTYGDLAGLDANNDRVACESLS